MIYIKELKKTQFGRLVRTYKLYRSDDTPPLKLFEFAARIIEDFRWIVLTEKYRKRALQHGAQEVDV